MTKCGTEQEKLSRTQKVRPEAGDAEKETKMLRYAQ